MTNPEHQFTTDSSPDEEEFKRTARDAASHFKDVLLHDCQWYSIVHGPMIEESVRTALEKYGTATPRRVEDVIESKTLGERYSERDRDAVLTAFQEAIRLTDR